jgi:hypothetical protein
VHRHLGTLPGVGEIAIVERLVRLAARPEAPVRVAVAVTRATPTVSPVASSGS